jgi:hypothetical protein
MRKNFLPVILICLGFALVGCGGGGGGGDNGGDDGGIDANTSLIGRWQPISALEDGTAVRVSTAMMNWDASWTRGEINFLGNGTCEIRGYDGSDLVDTITGSWNSDAGIAPVTIGGVTTTIEWGDYGYFMHKANFARGGHNYQTKWVKMVNLTEHTADLTRTWRVDSIQRNGTSVTPAAFFPMQPGSDYMTMQMLSSGEMILRELNDGIIVQRKDGSWVSGGGTFRITLDGESSRGYYEGNAIVFLDSAGDTIKMNLGRWAADGFRNPALQGKWQATSATLDGNPYTLSEALEWDPGVTEYHIVLWLDGTAESRDYAGANLQSAELGTWSTNGSQITVNFGELFVGTFAILGGGNTLQVTIVEGGHYLILNFAKIS